MNGRCCLWRVWVMLIAVTMSFGLGAKSNNKHRKGGSRAIAGEYIVMLEMPEGATQDEVAALAADVAGTYHIRVDELWSDVTTAFFTHMNDERAAEVSLDPRVRLVEENVEWELSSTIQTNIDPATCDPTSGTCSVVGDNRLWHLDRIDQNLPTPSLTQSYCTTGAGRVVYVVDTGVDKNHQEFAPGGTRVLKGYNASLDGMDADDPCIGFAIPPGDHVEERANYVLELGRSGHGTGVASLVGGRRLGVARNVTIIPVKIARCDRYSARLHRTSTQYVQNETMFVVTPVRYYRALTTGQTGSVSPTWSTTSNVNRRRRYVAVRVIVPCRVFYR